MPCRLLVVITLFLILINFPSFAGRDGELFIFNEKTDLTTHTTNANVSAIPTPYEDLIQGLTHPKKRFKIIEALIAGQYDSKTITKLMVHFNHNDFWNAFEIIATRCSNRAIIKTTLMYLFKGKKHAHIQSIIESRNDYEELRKILNTIKRERTQKRNKLRLQNKKTLSKKSKSNKPLIVNIEKIKAKRLAQVSAKAKNK